MSVYSQQSAPTIKAGDPITADFLNSIAANVLQRVSIVGGEITRNGTSLCINVSGRRGGAGVFFWGKITTLGPADEADYTDARYWVIEQTRSVDEDTKWTFADKESGRHVTATNLLELGIGTSDAGTHGCIYTSGEAPARGGAALTAPSRYVRVFSDGDKYFFESLPVVLIEDSYYLDVYGVDGDGCPDAYKWWKGVIPFGIVDYDVTVP